MSQAWQLSPIAMALIWTAVVILIGLIKVAPEAYAISWPNHLAWIGFGFICLGAGFWVRQRRDARR